MTDGMPQAAAAELRPLDAEEFQPSFLAWARTWDLPTLPEQVAITFTRRLKRSLGRCSPADRRVRVNARLLDGPPELLREVLCHELAHVAVHLLHGRSVRPHGAEWARLDAARRLPAARSRGRGRSTRLDQDRERGGPAVPPSLPRLRRTARGAPTLCPMALPAVSGVRTRRAPADHHASGLKSAGSAADEFDEVPDADPPGALDPRVQREPAVELLDDRPEDIDVLFLRVGVVGRHHAAAAQAVEFDDRVPQPNPRAFPSRARPDPARR